MKYNSIVKMENRKRGGGIMEQMKEVYNELTDANKDVINLVAKGMLVAQEAEKENKKAEGVK